MINCPHSERIPVESGLAYRIEMWAKCLKGENERQVPYVVAYDANGRENLNVGCRIARVTDNDPRDVRPRQQHAAAAGYGPRDGLRTPVPRFAWPA